MKPRLNFFHAAPDTLKALRALDAQVQASGLEPLLMELVKTRASQINGCAFCINMHTEDARKRGETEQRLYQLNAWQESPLYSARERAALAWTEAVTLISKTHAPDDVYEAVSAQFSEAERVNLTVLISTMEPALHQLPRDSSGEGRFCGGLIGSCGTIYTAVARAKSR
jgi:AhpD family alkylhydroperoxidase